MERWRRRSVAIGGFDEMENINKIICQNISKQLCKLGTVVRKSIPEGSFDSHKRRRVMKETEGRV